MKKNHHPLERLLKAAARAPQDWPTELPFGVETRILAYWRASRCGAEWDGLLRFIRVGLGCAAILTLVIIALSLRHIAQEPADEFAMPNVALNLAFLH